MTLKELQIGKSAVIKSVGSHGALRQHFLDMGIIPQVDVTMVKHAPMGDPVEVRVHGYELTLRLSDAHKIQVENERDASHDGGGKSESEREELPHPGLGEGGKYHELWYAQAQYYAEQKKRAAEMEQMV